MPAEARIVYKIFSIAAFLAVSPPRFFLLLPQSISTPVQQWFYSSQANPEATALDWQTPDHEQRV
jgi:hypothetical protein